MSRRKGFNFYASYYDVFKELSTAQDKADFIEAILDRQFTGKEPDDLQGLAKFAYISQQHSIDAQVLGYESKTGSPLTPCQGGSVGGSQGGAVAPSVQEKEKEKGKEKEQHSSVPDTNQATPSKMGLFLNWYNEIRKEYLPKSRGITAWTDKAKRNFKKTKGKGYTKGDIKHGIRAAFDDPHHKESKWHYVTLEFITREDILQRYVNTEGASREKEYAEMTPAEKAAKYID
ncbi:MAG: hypothetical protein GQ553_03480 [Nitrosomonadaceae bacterium]|nr:hypothetical protein [Nitrosomonadaceae bacterium]